MLIDIYKIFQSDIEEECNGFWIVAFNMDCFMY
jgi:hypothetical protein